MNKKIDSHYESVIGTTTVSWMVEQLDDPTKLCRIYGKEREGNNSRTGIPYAETVAFTGLAECASASEAE